ncbi:hypothetical protein RKD23_007403 [Streptomyces sp. SAI-170]|uniref:hypothetical protein n=1 Tax=Streptomyces sp. SAI-170 TaxID=3377729 RepID=UPI003C7C937C
MNLFDLIGRPFHLHTRADSLAIGADDGQVMVGGKPSPWQLEPASGRDAFRILSSENLSLAWTALEGTKPLRVGLLPSLDPDASSFRIAPFAGEEGAYEILYGQDKGVSVYKPNETGPQPLTLLGASSAYPILITPA